MKPWRTAITRIDSQSIEIRGHSITELMERATFTEVIFLLHQSRLPTEGERRLFNAILIAGCDHGVEAPSALAARTAASGNRAAIEAPIAAGILAIGDVHGGAGQACMELIDGGIRLAKENGLSLAEAAARLVNESRSKGTRIPGLGHRQHQTDPRASTLFRLAVEENLAGAGIEMIQALERAASEQIKPLPTNVDGAIAGVLYDLGFAPRLAKALFILARTAGLTAHVMEEYGREKPMRIHIPSVYDGPEADTTQS